MADRIGFIGLGIMGQGMARNVLRAGYELVVWNRTVSKTAPLVEAGAAAAESPAEVARQSDIILICVSDTPDVEAVVLGEGGVLEGAGQGKLVIDHSTISPSATLALAPGGSVI